MQLAALFGESDEEIAARQQHEQAQDASISNLTQEVSDLEHSLRQLTGQLEEANHQNAVLQQKIDRMQKDFDYRLCQLSAQQLGGSDDSSGGGLSCAPGGGAPGAAPMTMPPSQSGSAAPAQAGQPSGVLGTLPQGASLPKPHPDVSVNMSAVGGAPGASAFQGSPDKAEFDSAMNLLAKAQYDEARAGFRGFADAHPKDDLAPQAVYWVGAIAYVQKDYPGAAKAFVEEIKKYPSSPRAPESMLKLGQSLIAMNQKKEGCSALGALPSQYPKASKSVLHQAEDASHAAHCR
jgi:tol-pal system protein YbgF